jgi:RNA polymerase sigma factor (sigma-70 family)
VNTTLDHRRLLSAEELVRAYVAGDEEALTELRRRYRRVPAAAARRHALSRAAVDEIVHETWQRFSACTADIDDREGVVNWLWTTASSLARSVGGRDDLASRRCEPPAESTDGRPGEPRDARDFARHDNGTLVVLAQRGCEQAFEELVRRLDSLVATLAHRYRLRPADAADVAQVTFLQLHRHLHALRQPERVLGWVATTARHECLRVVQRRAEEPLDPDVLQRDHTPNAPDTCDAVLQRERVAVVEQAMRKVPERSQKLLKLLMWDECSYREVSADLEMPIGSIGPTLQRSLNRVARQPEIIALAEDRVAG